ITQNNTENKLFLMKIYHFGLKVIIFWRDYFLIKILFFFSKQ
ncbi:hypothetical protein M153_34630001703, partial [Pseudoloma neurophilia]